MDKKEDRRGRPKTKMECFASIVGDLKIMLPTIVVLLGGTVYGNSDTVKKFVHGKPPPTVEEIQPVEDGHLAKSVEDIVKAIKRIDAEILKLKQRDNSDKGTLQSQIDDLKKWHD